jgi:two-component system KDP operon response regulator KdpE
MKPSVLLVDKDPIRAEQLRLTLSNRGYAVRMAADSADALASFTATRPALVIAQLEMPDIDGLEICQRVRGTSSTPVIILSDDGDAATEVMALESGADDFLVQPVRPERLFARIRLALRHGGTTEASVYGVGPFNIDFNDRRVHVRGQAVRLTPKEFDLFTFMARHPNRVLPHKALLGAVWGGGCEEQSEYLRVFVGQLRKKLEADPAHPQHLLTEPWVGYRFNPSGTAHA